MSDLFPTGNLNNVQDTEEQLSQVLKLLNLSMFRLRQLEDHLAECGESGAARTLRSVRICVFDEEADIRHVRDHARDLRQKNDVAWLAEEGFPQEVLDYVAIKGRLPFKSARQQAAE